MGFACVAPDFQSEGDLLITDGAALRIPNYSLNHKIVVRLTAPYFLVTQPTEVGFASIALPFEGEGDFVNNEWCGFTNSKLLVKSQNYRASNSTLPVKTFIN